MIDRQNDKVLIECDSCEAVFEGEPGEEFPDVWRSAKRDGWRTKKTGDEWVHGCERCGV